MASAATFASLQAPAPEDTMEMSSPGNRHLDDDDIDIDYDESTGGVNLTDDERMMEDGEQTRPPTATDDMMEDDAQPPAELHVQESEMQDDFDPAAYEQANDDDELIDYGDEEFIDFTEAPQEAAEVPPAPEVEVTDDQPAEADTEQVDEEIVREPEVSAVDFAPEVVDEVTITEEPALADSGEYAAFEENAHDVHDDTATVLEPTEDGDAGNAHDVHNSAQQEDATASALPASGDEEHVATDGTVPGRPLPAQINTAFSFNADAPGTPTDTGLHPVTLCYGDNMWPLFKSKKQPDGILKDDNLASVGLADMLSQCRQRFVVKDMGQVSEDQELVLFFEGLGLTVTEDSPSAANTSLEEVLEVYKKLYVNDGYQEMEIPSLSLVLSTQLRFSSHFMMYKQGVEAGQGMSAYQTSVDHRDYEHQQDHEDQDDNEAAYEAADHEEPTTLDEHTGEEYYDQEQDNYGAGDGPTEDEIDYQEYATADENAQGNYDETHGLEQAEEFADDQIDFTAYEEYAENEAAADTAAEPEDEQGVPEQATAPVADASGNDTTDGHQATDQDAAAAANAEGQDGNANVESVASSTTLRGSNTNDAVEHGDNEDDLAFLTALDGEEEKPVQAVAEHDKGGAKQPELDQDANKQVSADAPPKIAAVVQEGAISLEPAPGAEDQEAAFALNGQANEDELYDDETYSGEDDEGLNFDDQPFNPTDNAEALYDDADNSHESHHHLNGDQAGQAEDGLEDFDDDPPPVPADEDSIDFDDETEEQHEARKASQSHINTTTKDSPSGKRSFDETEQVDAADERELKKARSS